MFSALDCGFDELDSFLFFHFEFVRVSGHACVLQD